MDTGSQLIPRRLFACRLTRRRPTQRRAHKLGSGVHSNAAALPVQNDVPVGLRGALGPHSLRLPARRLARNLRRRAGSSVGCLGRSSSLACRRLVSTSGGSGGGSLCNRLLYSCGFSSQGSRRGRQVRLGAILLPGTDRRRLDLCPSCSAAWLLQHCALLLSRLLLARQLLHHHRRLLHSTLARHLLCLSPCLLTRLALRLRGERLEQLRLLLLRLCVLSGLRPFRLLLHRLLRRLWRRLLRLLHLCWRWQGRTLRWVLRWLRLGLCLGLLLVQVCARLRRPGRPHSPITASHLRFPLLLGRRDRCRRRPAVLVPRHVRRRLVGLA